MRSRATALLLVFTIATGAAGCSKQKSWTGLIVGAVVVSAAVLIGTSPQQPGDGEVGTGLEAAFFGTIGGLLMVGSGISLLVAYTKGPPPPPPPSPPPTPEERRRAGEEAHRACLDLRMAMQRAAAGDPAKLAELPTCDQN